MTREQNKSIDGAYLDCRKLDISHDYDTSIEAEDFETWGLKRVKKRKYDKELKKRKGGNHLMIGLSPVSVEKRWRRNGGAA